MTKRLPLPRLLGPDLRPAARLHPLRLSVTLNLRPPSRATMLLPPEEAPALRALIELFTPQGSAGYFRVTAVDHIPGEGCEVTLRHAAVTLSDALIPGQGELTGSAQQVLTALLSRQTASPRWTLGEVALPESRQLSCAYRNSNLLAALLNLLDELPGYGFFFEQRGADWTLHLRALPSADECECRLSRNLRSLTVTRDDGDLCTRVYVNGLPEPLDAETLPEYGVVSRSLTANPRLGAAALTALGRAYLDRRCRPALTVRLDALDLHRATGESLDGFPPGRLCRVALPGEGAVIRERVVSVTYGDVYGAPEQAEVTLADRFPDAADYVSGLMANVQVVYRDLADAEGLIRLEADRIELLAREIQLKATHEELTDLGLRVSEAEIRIDGMRADILLRASREEVTALGDRLSQAEIDINGAKADILLRASREDVTRLGDRVSQAEIDIDGAKADILLRANREDVTRLGDRLSQAEIDISGAKADILLKADRSTVSDIEKRTAQAEIDIDGAKGQIALKASQEYADYIHGSLRDAWSSIEVLSGQIALAASQSVADDLGTRLTRAEVLIDGANAAIALKASQSEMDTVYHSLVDAWSSIELLSTGVSQKVGKGEIISEINQTAESVVIKASRIDLSGYVTAKELEAEIARIDKIFSGQVSYGSLVGGNIYANFLQADKGLSVYGSPAEWREASVMTALPSLTPQTFHMTYKDANGINQAVDVVTGVTFNRGALGTINYLGR